MLNNLLAGLGVNGTTVDAVLDASAVMPGQTLSGRLFVQGGRVDQDLRAIDLAVIAHCRVEAGDDTARAEISFADARISPGTISAGKRMEFPFAMKIPLEVPLSVGGVTVFLRSTADIAQGRDAGDRDPISITPDPAMQTVFAALEGMDFRLADAEIEYDRRRRFPLIQEFDFLPPRGRHTWRIEEVEIAFRPAAAHIDVDLVVDTRGGLFRAGHERKASFRVDRKTAMSRTAIMQTRDIIDEAISRLAR